MAFSANFCELYGINLRRFFIQKWEAKKARLLDKKCMHRIVLILERKKDFAPGFRNYNFCSFLPTDDEQIVMNS